MRYGRVNPANPSTLLRAGAGIYCLLWISIATLCAIPLHAMIPAASFYLGGGADYTAVGDRTDSGVFASAGILTRGGYLNLDLGKTLDSNAVRGELEFAKLFPLSDFSRAIMVVPSAHAGVSVSQYSGVYAGLGVSLYPIVWISYSVYYYPAGNSYLDREIAENTLRLRAVWPLSG